MALISPDAQSEKLPPVCADGSAALALSGAEPKADKADPARRTCLATGEELEKSRMIRFVIDPSGVVTPDVAAKLPGRGLWVAAERAALEKAILKNMFSKAARRKVELPPDLLATVQSLLARRSLDFLGLAKAANAVISGEPKVEEALRKGTLSYTLLADDAGGDIVKKMGRSALYPCGFGREALGQALGRETCVAVGLKPGSISDKLMTELLRWRGVSAPLDQNGGASRESEASVRLSPDVGKAND